LLFDELFDISERVAAVVVLTIGDLSGFPVFRNVTAASRAVEILSDMLPVESKISPMLNGESSLGK